MVVVTGHRGAGFLEPENTIRSIRRAIELGVDQVEIDVHLSRDGKLVVIHDETLDRTTNGHGFVRDYTLAELKKLDAGKGEKIPTLQEVIDAVKGKVMLQIELKEPAAADQVVKTVEDNGLVGDVIVTSFWHHAVKRVKELNPRIETGVLFACSPIDVAQLAINAGADALHANFNYVDSSMVEEAHRHGLKIRVWNPDDEYHLKRIAALDVDAIGSNRPDLLLKLLKRR